jgi:predicted DNA-binding protein with PD1-like motif
MQVEEGRIGRVFVIRLEHGEELPECIENLAADKAVSHAQAILIGGIDQGQVVAGPRNSNQRPPEAIALPIDGAHELLAVGILAPDEEGRPRFHIHAALGRCGNTKTGCLRLGVKTWVMAEVILYELLDVKAIRVKEPDTGFQVLQPAAS